MRTEHSPDAYASVAGAAPQLAAALEAVRAVGLSGSRARGSEDALSDIDMCVYVDGGLPSPSARRQAYDRLGFADPVYFDVDFGYSRGDGFSFRGTRCDFNWMSMPEIRSCLDGLDTDFDCSEYVPGGLAAVKPLHDPDEVIRRLQETIPPYSDPRAEHRIRKAIREAHFSLYDLGWLEKAAFRNDGLLFLKYQSALLDQLVRALFALNHAWLADEKGLARRIAGFPFAPEAMEHRIQSAALHHGEDADLHRCLSDLKGMCADTVRSVRRRYPDLDLPAEWK